MKIPISKPALLGREVEYVNDCLARNELSSVGAYVGRLEEAFAKFCGVKHAIACASGTAGLHLAMLAVGIRSQDRVLVPALTYVATANAVRYCQATPVFCDVDPHTWCIDPEDTLRHVIRLKRDNVRVAGIIPVHLYGVPADMFYFRELSARYGLWLIEDACEAHGATISGQRVGSLGELGVFSFYGNKLLTSGEGGIVTTNSDELARLVRLYRGQGVEGGRGNYFHRVVGYNYRLTNIQAAIALAQLEEYEQYARARAKITQWYRDLLPREYAMQQPSQNHLPADWLVTIVFKPPEDRDAVAQRMYEDGIETRPVFPVVPKLPMYLDSGQSWPWSSSMASQISDYGLSLPTWVGMTQDDVKQVVASLTGVTA